MLTIQLFKNFVKKTRFCGLVVQRGAEKNREVLYLYLFL